MKALQNNFTTPEQSKRLLDLGVPAWSANIMFDKNRRRYELIETEDESLAETQRTLFYNGGAIPHWSVGQLMEIFDMCYVKELSDRWYTYRELNEGQTYIDYLLYVFTINKMQDLLDFSKLEE